MNFVTESLNEPIDDDFLITSGREFHKIYGLSVENILKI